MESIVTEMAKVAPQEIEGAVRRFLESDLSEHSFDEVVDTVTRELRTSDAEVKAAIWRLHSLSEIELTANWNLKSTAIAA
jgi:hypothetical protein